MKSALLVLAFLVAGLTYSQDKFKYSASGMDPEYLVVSVDSLSQSQLYDKTIVWIKNYYKNPDEVIETKSENDFVRFSGIKQNAFQIGSIYIDLKYTIKISFRDGRYKFEPIIAEFKAVSEYSTDWFQFDFDDGSDYYKNDKVIKKFEAYTTEIPNLFNDINSVLLNSINSKDDDW